MKNSTLESKVLNCLKDADAAMAAKETVTGSLLGLARAAPKEEFITALKAAEAKYRQEHERLPQPYMNTKSTILYALKHEVQLGRANSSFHALRERVAEHRRARRSPGERVDRSAFMAAVSEVKGRKDPALIEAATKALTNLYETWGIWQASTTRAEVTEAAPVIRRRGRPPNIESQLAH